ncbi:MAG: hypothetical protein WC523_04870 [Patescibacteria group bacterium]
MAIRLTQEQAQEFIKNKGGKLLSVYISSRKKVTIKCLKDDYIWSPKWNNVTCGKWCPKCAKNSPIPIENVEEFVANHCGLIVDKSNFINAKSKIEVKCLKDNYIWSTTWDRLKHGSWCPKCANKILLTENEISKFVLNLGGELLGLPNGLKNNLSRLKIRCLKDGHIWFPIYSSVISSKSWCPVCSGHRNQLLLSDIIKDIFFNNVVQYNQYPFSWLKNNRKLEIDIWLPDIKLAIEYDGEQHFMPIKFGSTQTKNDTQKKLLACIKRDKLKDKLIKEHPEEVKYFIRFNFKEKLTKECVINKLKKHGVPLPF